MMNYTEEKELNDLGEKLRTEYREIIVDCIVYNQKTKKILTQKRSDNRRLFPGLWEFPGSLLEPNESLLSCIRRTIHEECQMQVENILELVHMFTWDDDKEVVTVQFLVEASGKYVPEQDKVSNHEYIGMEELSLLSQEGNTPIYRGAVYAFQYLDSTPNSSQFVMFFDKLIVDFFSFMNITDVAPIVTITEGGERFTLDKEEKSLKISRMFMDKYGEFGSGNIILHQLYHNYCQNILTFQNVKAIRSIMGKNFMYYVDITADAYTYMFLSARYGFSKDDYLKMCFKSIAEYSGDSLENSKLTRLLGIALTMETCAMKSFEVVLPVIDTANSRLHLLKFDKLIHYDSLDLSGQIITTLKKIFVTTKSSEELYINTLRKIINVSNRG
jgi:8-oxo-dGTP pyrophosphatase MutT (NUDIX family)